MSNICWAFAKLLCKAETLFEAVAGQHKKILASGEPQHLSNIIWAFGKLGCKSEILFSAVAKEHKKISKQVSSEPSQAKPSQAKPSDERQLT